MEWKVKRCRERASAEEHLTDRELEKKIRQIDAGRARHQKLLTDRNGALRKDMICASTPPNLEIKKIIPGLKEMALCWFE